MYNRGYLAAGIGVFFLYFALSPVHAQTPAKPSMWYLTDLEKEVVRELNRVRRDPQGYVTHLKALKKLYEGNMVYYPGEATLMTNEGVEAVDECIQFLENAQPIDTLGPSEGMSKAARDHMKEQSRSGKTGHTGDDGSSPFDRIERYGQWERTAGENIDYGSNDARRIVISLLVDDGVPSRGHRENIFNPEFRKVGVACGTHKQYRYMCVMTLAGGFSAKKNTVHTRGENPADGNATDDK